MFPNINIDSKAFVKLIDVVSKGIGAIYRPYGIVREAKAKAQEKLILTIADAKCNEIAYHAVERLKYLELRRQRNIERITIEAAEYLQEHEKIDETPVDEDWAVYFFQQAQDVGNDLMQRIWARILAGEVKKPGSYSLRTLDVVKKLSKKEAEYFTTYCGLLWNFKNGQHFLLSSKTTNKYLATLKISVFDHKHLRDISLVSSVDLFYQFSEIKKVETFYFGDRYRFKGPEIPPKGLDKLDTQVTITPLTDIGDELARICGAKPIPAYIQELVTDINNVHKVTIEKIM